MTGIILGAILEWATGKVADTLLAGVNSKLNRNDIDKALKLATKAAEEKYSAVFFNCKPNDKAKFLEEFFTTSGLEELRKPLNNQGKPDTEFLTKAFLKLARERKNKLGEIQQESVKDWIKVFVETYFQQTNNYLRFQVAKEDYFEQLANWYDDVKFAGMAVPGQEVEKSAQLANIFVMPDVREEGRSGEDRWLEAELLGEATDSRQFGLLQQQLQWAQLDSRFGRKSLAKELLSQSQSRRLVMLSAPGSGKTTLMSYFAVMLADKEPETLGLSPDKDLLPILIRIRDLMRQPGLSVLEYLRLFAEKTLEVKKLPEGFFEYWLEDGRTLILLDGLDEVAESGKRHEVVKRIENFLGQYQQNRAIITSRPAGYRRDFFNTAEFPHYWLQPFDNDKIEEFINRWYDSRIQDKEEAKRRKESLRKALDDNDRIKLLARNPLLLTIIVLIHRYQAHLPKKRYELYDKAVETLLISWDANKELSNESVLKYLDLDDLRRLLAILACWVHNQGSTGDREGGTLIDRDELVEQLSREIKTLKQVQLYQAQEEAERFVNFMRERTGLLNEQGRDCYAFVHKTFQEYLCAEEIDYQADNEGDFEIILDCIREHLHDSHWDEVLLLLIAQQKPKKAAKAIRVILNHNSEYEQWLHRDLFLAGSCLAEDIKGLKGADGNLVEEILEGLVELEVSDSEQVGEKVREQVFEIISSFNETEFEVQALQMLKDKSNQIDEERLDKYRVALGEKEAVIKTYIAQLDDEDYWVRISAAEALGNLGEASEVVVTGLLAKLENEDYWICSSAAEALGNLGEASEVMVTALVAKLEDEDFWVRLSAAYALGELGEASEVVVTALLVRLEDADSEVRRLAAEALGELGEASEVVVNALLDRLEDADSGVRSSTAYALGELGEASEMVVNALLARLEDDNSEVGSSAAYALGELGEASEMVVNALLVRLEDDNSEVRSSAAYALGNLGEASEVVVTALVAQDDNSEVGSSAAYALGKLGEASEVVVTALLAKLKDKDFSACLSAAQALGELGEASEVVVTALVAKLEDEDFLVCLSAAQALGKLGKKSDQILPQIVQWIEQHQDSEYIGYGIDALWDLVVRQ